MEKLRPFNSFDGMKSEQNVAKHEEHGHLDGYVSQAIIQEPFLSFSSNTPFPLIQLLNALDQQANNRNPKGSNIENGINTPTSDTNGAITMVSKGTSEIEKYLPGWPLMSPSKIPLQKCGKCSLEFCSTINYRRHVRIHRRSINIDKVCPKSREYLCPFLDKLSLDEQKELFSFSNVALEEVDGLSIINALTMLIRRSWFSSLPQVYLKAGSILLDLVQANPSRFPISSQDLFSVLDDASEKTFLCAGSAVSLQKFVFDGGVGKIAFDPKNVIACTSFVIEQKLVKAWLANKEAEALRCEKLLVEEEEAAQKRQAQLLEKKRQKKLRQKEHRAKEHSAGNKTKFKGNASNVADRAFCRAELPGTTPSLDISLDIPGNSFGTLNSMVEDASMTCEFDSGDNHRQHKSGQKETVVSQTLPLSKPTNPTNGFQQIPTTTKCMTMKKTCMVWTEKNKTETERVCHRSDKVELVTREGSNESDNSEVLIGSITVSVGNNNNLEISVQDNITKDRPFKHDALTLPNGGCQSSVTQWKPVSRQEGSRDPLALQKISMRETEPIPAEQNSLHHGGNGSSIQDTDSALKNTVGGICSSTPQMFSSEVAMDFLTQRWKAAVSSEHVKVGVLPTSELPKSMKEEVLQSLDCSGHSILGRAENLLSMVDHHHDSAATSRVYKSKIQPKPDKNYRMKYIPKQRNGMLER